MPELVQVHGLKELRQALTQTVPQHFRRQTLQKALSAGALLVVRLARRLAPQGATGVLRRAIYLTRDARASNGVFEQKIIGVRSGKRFQKGKTNRDAWYWRFVEFGRGVVEAGSRYRMVRGSVRNRRTQAQVLGTPARGFFGKRVQASRPRPSLRPAFDSQKGAALEAIKASLAQEIPLAAEKGRWRNLLH